MIFKILFNPVGLTIVFSMVYIGVKLILIGISLRNRYARVIEYGWNGHFSKSELKALQEGVDEGGQRDIDTVFRLLAVRWKIFTGGVFLLLVVIISNKILNG